MAFFGNGYQKERLNMEERKRGRPLKFSKEHLLQMKVIFGDTKSGKRLLQNHISNFFVSATT